MNKFDIRDITDHCYHDGTVNLFNQLYFSGSFPEEETEATGLVSFSFCFLLIKETDILGDIPDLKDAEILKYEIKECEEGYYVKICVRAEDAYCVEFHCMQIQSSLYSYDGMSYKNIYDNMNFSEALQYTTDEKFFEDGEKTKIADDLIIVHKGYCYGQYNSEGKCEMMHRFGKYSILKNDMEIYSFLNIDDQVNLKEPLILHSNGRRYIAFHVDLYGLSYIDPDTLEVYNYVPEGYQHDFRSIAGESFIITDIHYDRNTDLVAYGGCWWAAPSEVYIGYLNDPLCYNPHLIRIHEWLDPEWDEIMDIDFVRWDSENLVLNCDGKEVKVPIEKILKALNV